MRGALCCALLVAAALAAARVPGLFASPMPMDFVAQSANTPADQALQARGPDHDIDTAANDPFVTVLGDHVRPCSALRP